MKYIIILASLMLIVACSKEVKTPNTVSRNVTLDTNGSGSDTVIHYASDTSNERLPDTLIITRYIHDTVVIVDTVYGMYATGNPKYIVDPIYVYVYPDTAHSNTHLIGVIVGDSTYVPNERHEIYPDDNALKQGMILYVSWSGSGYQAVAWTRDYFDPFKEVMSLMWDGGNSEYMAFPGQNSAKLLAIYISDYGFQDFGPYQPSMSNKVKHSYVTNN